MIPNPGDRPPTARDQAREPLPFGTNIWTSKSWNDSTRHVTTDLYGPKTARLWAGDAHDGDHNYLSIMVDKFIRLDGPTYVWEEFAEVLNEALRQHRLYRERIGERPQAAEQPEAER